MMYFSLPSIKIEFVVYWYCILFGLLAMLRKRIGLGYQYNFLYMQMVIGAEKQ